MKKAKGRSPWVQAGRYSQLAFLIPCSLLVGYAIGYYLDKAFETTFIRVIGLLVGVISGFIEMIREIQKNNRD